MKPTEHEMTVAVDAAARYVHERTAPEIFGQRATFEQLNPVVRLKFREDVLDLVLAVLGAIPDRTEATLRRVLEGCCTCHTGDAQHEEWCVAAGVAAELESMDSL